MNTQSTTDTRIGVNIGNYVIRRKLGEGGMGSVYLAEHPLLQHHVAIKILHPEMAAREDVATRFLNEARTVNEIGHPNIVAINDYGVIGRAKQRLIYMVMEYLEGRSLDTLLHTRGPLSPKSARSIGRHVARALSACHARGVIHRDLKPANLMLVRTQKGRVAVKVLDFGIAKMMDERCTSVSTRTGMLLGTPAYMSPEQCRGNGQLDDRSDIYSLGIVLYELIAGRVPFQGSVGQVITQHLTRAPTSLRAVRATVSPDLDAVIMRALAKKPCERYPSMMRFMTALEDPSKYAMVTRIRRASPCAITLADTPSPGASPTGSPALTSTATSASKSTPASLSVASRLDTSCQDLQRLLKDETSDRASSSAQPVVRRRRLMRIALSIVLVLALLVLLLYVKFAVVSPLAAATAMPAKMHGQPVTGQIHDDFKSVPASRDHESRFSLKITLCAEFYLSDAPHEQRISTDTRHEHDQQQPEISREPETNR